MVTIPNAHDTKSRERGAERPESTVSEGVSQSPPGGSRDSSPQEEGFGEKAAIIPRYASESSDDPALLAEFLDGAGVLRLTGERARPGVTLQPQQYHIAGVLNAGHEFNAISAPRRSSKTTAILAVILGRLMNREGYQACMTLATTALKARERFLSDVVGPIEQVHPDPASSPWKIVRANGREQVLYKPTGSRLAVLPPRGDALRGDAWDCILIDEAGAASIELGDDLLAGGLSTLDTRPDAQLILAGTAAKFRDGQLLWKALEEGRAGKGGIVEYAAEQDITAADVDTWGKAGALLKSVHPGLMGLTTLDRMRSRWEKLARGAWLAEYLGVFGQVGSAAFLNVAGWALGRQPGDTPHVPAAFAMAFAVHPDSTTASLMAAWRDDDGHAVLGLLWHGPVRGLRDNALKAGRRHRLPVGYDSGNSATDSEAQRIDRARPAIDLVPQKWADVSTAAALLTAEIDSGNVFHFGQQQLDTAVAVATKRGTKESKRWSFGRPEEESDITPLEAGAIALRMYDDDPPREKFRPYTAQ